MEKPSVAMLIDWENIKYSTEKLLKSPPDIIVLKKVARKYGKLAVSRAYANWSDLSHQGDMERLSLQDIEPVFVYTREITGEDGQCLIKSSVDIKIACDSIELLLKNPEISTFVLASGDGGFRHIKDKIKVYGKHVCSVGVSGTTSNRLGVISEDLMLYDDLITGLTAKQTSSEINTFLDMFKQAVEHINKNQMKNSLDVIKSQMQAFDKNFEEENIGIPSFRHLAYLAEKRGLVKIDGTSVPATAYKANQNTSNNGRLLYHGEIWAKIINDMNKKSQYTWKALYKLILKIINDAEKTEEFLKNAIKSEVLWKSKRRVYKKKLEKEEAVEHYFLNTYHPRVQVYLNRQPGK